MKSTVLEIAQKAREASVKMTSLSTAIRNNALIHIAGFLDLNRSKIISANLLDMDNAKSINLSEALVKRLIFDDMKISKAISGLQSLSKLPDPVGRTTYHCELDRGLELYRVTCPMGVIGMIFESRPDALVQISALCLKSSNAVILKGGTEASHTNKVLVDVIREATENSGLPDNWISLLETRSDVNDMLKLDSLVDLIIPRGSKDLVRMIKSSTDIPVLGHADGVCHTYIDSYASVADAIRICIDAKVQSPSTCNATETILVHTSISEQIIPQLASKLHMNEVNIYGCERTRSVISCGIVKDWHTEYLESSVSIKVVDSLEDAINHINFFGSGHTDAVITGNKEVARKFMSQVDSGNVFWNCSTRFSDGFVYGFGAEVGVSTSKLHARGPVGLEGLVTYKYKLFGNGQIIDDYIEGRSTYTHKIDNEECPFER